MGKTLNWLQGAGRLLLPVLFALVLTSYAIDMLDHPAFGQNVEGQIIASQYGQWQLQGTQTNSFVFSPAACQVKGGNKNFSALKQGTPVRIVDPGNSALYETLIAGLVNIHACSVQLLPVSVHNPPFYLTSGTAGLQEAIDANETANGPNSIILSADWYRQGGSAAIIASVTGIPTLSLVDITTTPYTWYEWNGLQYAAVPVGSGGSPGGLTGAFQYNSGGSFAGSTINGLVKGNGASAPTAAVAGTDYQAPLGYTPANVANNLSDLTSASSARTNLGLGISPQLAGILNTSPSTQLNAALIPTLNQNTTGNAATATALASTPSQCPGSQVATGIGANGNANCTAPASGVPSVNGVASAVTMAASGTGLTVSTVGGVVTYSLSGGAGTGAVGSAAQYACGEYPATGTTIGGAANCYILPVGLNTTQINTFLAAVESANPNGASVILQNGDSRTPFTGYANIRILDLRTGASVAPRSTTEFGAQCDAVLAFGTLTSGSDLLDTPDYYSFSSADVDKWISMVGSVSGIATRFDAQITQINSSTEAQLSANAPFSETNYSVTIGHDDTPSNQAALEAAAADIFVVSFPSGPGLCWSRIGPLVVDQGQNVVGNGSEHGGLLGGAGMDALEYASNGGAGEEIGNFALWFDARINASLPWSFDNNGTTTSETPTYRPIGSSSALANVPFGPGWVRGSEPYGLNAFGGVGTTTAGGTSICVLAGGVPPAGGDIVFPQYGGGGIVHTTVASVGSSCTGGTTVNLASGTGLQAVTQNEFFYGEAPTASPSGTAVQEIATAIPATGRVWPITINLENPISPEPAAESDFAPFGLVQIDSEQFYYYGNTNEPVQSGSAITLTSSVQNGTGATGAAHSVGEAIVPLNPYQPTWPWPFATINGSGQTPANAEFFPALNVGNCGFSDPVYSGASWVGQSTLYRADVHDIQIDSWPTTTVNGSGENSSHFSSQNNTCGMYFGGTIPFNTHFRNLAILAPQLGIMEGTPSIDTHDWSAGAYPTADKTTWENISINAAVDFDFIGGGSNTWNNFQLFSSSAGPLGPFQAGVTNPSGGWGAITAGLWTGTFLDDLSGYSAGQYTAASGCHHSRVSSFYLEAEGGAYLERTPMWEFDCSNSKWLDLGDISGGVSFIGGSNDELTGAFLQQAGNMPLVVYGANTHIDGADNIPSGTLANTWGAGGLIAYAPNVCAEGTAAGGDSRLTYGNCAAVQPAQTQEFELFGNTTPYVNTLSGWFSSDTLNPVSAAGTAIGWTFDGTPANTNQGFEGCAVGVGVNTVECQLFLNGRANASPGIGPGQVLAATKYLMNIGVRECNAYPCTDAAQTFGIYLASSDGEFDQSHTAVPVTTTWTNVSLGVVDLSTFSGQTFQLMVNGTSTTPTDLEFGYISLVPLPGNFQAQQLGLSNGSAWTSGSSTPSGSCTAGSLYTNTSGSPNTLYVCQSGSWVGK